MSGMRILTFAILATALAGPCAAQSQYVKDVDFALDSIEEKCGRLIESKDIAWKKVRKEFRKEAKKVRDDQAHLVLLVRLLARLRDGHARVEPLEKGKNVRWPDDGKGRRSSPGMAWCRSGKKFYIRSSWGDAEAAGVKAGMEILSVNGVKTAKWVDAKVAELSDTRSFSTDHHALFFALNAGLMEPQGTRFKLQLKPVKGRKTKRTVTCGKDRFRPLGPVAPPELTAGDNISWGKTESGHGYLWVRRSRREIVGELDAIIEKLGDVEGIILDYRGNTGGGFDHDAFLGRFIPEGRSIKFSGNTRKSAGPKHFGGPVVVIVNAACVSAGETGSGMFKEEGRAYMIGESPTAGMSAGKTTIELPSRLFGLYVSTHSNKSWFNDGKGIEGLGVQPHEIVDLAPKDLAAGRDTLIARAESLLAKWPRNVVPYKPAQFGWK